MSSLEPAAGVTSVAVTNESASSKSATIDYNSFLQLLIAQLKYQDPTNPMKSSDYVSQLATFSQVEKSVQMNDRLGQVLISSLFEQAQGLIGNHLETADGAKGGVVVASRIVAGNVIATLDNGSEITLQPGLIIRKIIQ